MSSKAYIHTKSWLRPPHTRQCGLPAPNAPFSPVLVWIKGIEPPSLLIASPEPRGAACALPSSSQWTVHQNHFLKVFTLCHIDYFPASWQIAVEEHKRWAASTRRRRRQASLRSDASIVRLRRNPFSPRRWSLRQAHPDICQKPYLTSSVCRQINGCPVNYIIDLLMDLCWKGTIV